MKLLMLATTVVLGLFTANVVAAESARWADITDKRTFELTTMAPPKPALKYQFSFSDPGDQIAGNAAILYLQSVLLLGPKTREKIELAAEAFDTDKKAFPSLADSIDATSVLQEVELAGRRTDCNWESPFREMGWETLLPHLEPMLKGIGRLLWVRAHRQIEQGQTDEAIKTIRLGYEMSGKIGREGTLVSGLVAVAVGGMMDDCVAELMNRTDSPNLYWALSELPRRQVMLRYSLDVERQWELRPVPILAKTRSERLSAEQWRAVFANVQRLVAIDATDGNAQLHDAVQDASKETLDKAKKWYAAEHHLTAKQVDEVDPICVLGEYYLREYQIAYDEWAKSRGLDYPELIKTATEYDIWAKKLKQEQTSNPFTQTLPVMPDAIRKFARADRTLAALTAVEALRSYAAANGGKLPERLVDVTETPVPPNPMTGLPFQYEVTGGVAKISDSSSGETLEFTVKIRK